jgi:hypothetical protein
MGAFPGFAGRMEVFDDLLGERSNGPRWPGRVHAITFPWRTIPRWSASFYSGAATASAWQWNGAEWQVLTATGPAWRDVPGMVTDRRGGRIVMYGGNWDQPFNDLWVLSCDRWSTP